MSCRYAGRLRTSMRLSSSIASAPSGPFPWRMTISAVITSSSAVGAPMAASSSAIVGKMVEGVACGLHGGGAACETTRR